MRYDEAGYVTCPLCLLLFFTGPVEEPVICENDHNIWWDTEVVYCPDISRIAPPPLEDPVRV